MGDDAESARGGGRLVKFASSFAVVAVLAFLLGVSVGAKEGASVFAHLPLLGDGLSATPSETADLAPFWKAWNTLEERFVATHASSTPPSLQERVWGAIEGLTAMYGDPYTVFLPPEDAKIFEENVNGNFEGVGMEIGMKGGLLTIISPIKGTPAERAGLHAGDGILAIDGEPTDGLSVDEAVKRIRGPRGTVVSFSLLREGEGVEIAVVRDVITIPVVDYSFDKTTGIYTIALYSFTGSSVSLFDEALQGLRESGANKLIIDLRGDPGGYLEAAVDIASRFLSSGAVVVTEDYAGKQENVVHRSRGAGGVSEGTTIVVLIDQGSASASEILAGALRDHERATLIGRSSFGKGSVQELVDIDGGSLKITVARWLTPSGVSISDGGLTPDIKIDRTAEDFTTKRDPQMSRAIEFLTTGK